LVVSTLAGAMLAACGDDSTGLDLTPVASLEIATIPDTLLTRQTLKLEIETFDAEGSLLPDRPVGWESAEPAVASVTAGAVLRAAGPGTTVIRARAGEVVDSVTVTVRTLLLEHVYVGTSQSCGLEASGGAWCWGNVGTDGYGNGSLDTTRREVPARAAIGHTFSSLALARGSACGIETSGGVLCWGENPSGQLGDGTTTPHGAPAPTSGLTGIVQLAAGDSHFCARSSTGTVSCWGENQWFQTGQETRGIVTQPRPVELSGPASEIAAGAEHSCALVAGASYCWGADYRRQLGNDTTYDRLAPALAATGDGVSRTWSEVEASNRHTCGRDTAGAVLCWGVLEGQYDIDTVVWLPAQRFPGIPASDLADGWLRQCVVSDDQTAWCEGRGDPLVKLGASGLVSSVAVTGSEACVLQSDGAVACELATTPRGTLTQVPLAVPAVKLVASDVNVCAQDALDAVYCWFTWDALEPQEAFGTLTVTDLFGGSGRRICVITQSTAISCRDYPGGTETSEPIGGLTLVALAVGDFHACGLTAAGSAWCWGENVDGRLGDGTTTTPASAVPVQGGHVFTRITAGSAHTCGLAAIGSIYCWGNGSLGSMGDDNRDESADPVEVDGIPSLTRLGPAAPTSACGLDAAGSAWCWPTSFDISSARRIDGATGLVSTTGVCGLRMTGEMLCWGSNQPGWFGDGTFQVEKQAAVPGGSGVLFREVSFGLSGSACGVAVEGAAYCWGSAFGTSLGSPESRGELATLPLSLYGSP
jgi:alpha-tubulin suppressor-like RCC1 family protein